MLDIEFVKTDTDKKIEDLNNEINEIIDSIGNSIEYLINETKVDMSLFKNINVSVAGVDQVVKAGINLIKLKELITTLNHELELNDYGVEGNIEEMVNDIEHDVLYAIKCFEENLKNSGLKMESGTDSKIRIVSIK